MAKESDFSGSLRQFAALDVSAREAIVARIEAASPAVTVERLAKSIAEQTRQEIEMLRGLLEGLAHLVPIVADAPGESASDEVAASVSSALVRIACDSPQEGTKASELGEQFGRLLRCETPIGTTGKAQNIIWGHGHVFRDAHVVSQVRPIFFADLQKPVSAAVIVHELRLDYQQNSSDRSICLILDMDKVKQLQRVLDRALQKEEALRSDASFNYLAADEK